MNGDHRSSSFHRSKSSYDADKGKYDPDKPSKFFRCVLKLHFTLLLGGKALGNNHPAKDHNEDTRDKQKKVWWEK